MKKLLRLSTLLLTTLIGISSANAATAPTAGNATPTTATASTAIIDVNRILAESKAAKGLNEQMNTLRTQYEKEIYKKEEALRTQEKQLEGMKAEKLEKARKELEASVAQFQKSIMMQQNKLQQAAQEAMDKIREKVISISNEVAKSKGFVYVQPAAGFLYFPAETDITAATITRLDKELPEVKVTVKNEG